MSKKLKLIKFDKKIKLITVYRLTAVTFKKIIIREFLFFVIWTIDHDIIDSMLLSIFLKRHTSWINIKIAQINGI
jgi:hypothetical protein